MTSQSSPRMYLPVTFGWGLSQPASTRESVRESNLALPPSRDHWQTCSHFHAPVLWALNHLSLQLQS